MPKKKKKTEKNRSTRARKPHYKNKSLIQRINVVTKGLYKQIEELSKATKRFEQRDKEIFSKVVEACASNDMSRATIFAREAANMLVLQKTTMRSMLALEQIVLRLTTISELSDVVATLAPAAEVLRNVKMGASKLYPEAEGELGEIGNLLSKLIIDAKEDTGLTIDFEGAREDAERILAEAAAIAEKRIKEESPELKNGTP